MIRVRLLNSERLDSDARAHQAAIADIAGVAVLPERRAIEDRLPIILRAAAETFRGRDAADVVVAFGPAALAAATIGSRGPIIYVPLGEMRAFETSLIHSQRRRRPIRIVSASRTVTLDASRRGLGDITLMLRPAAPPATLDRATVRERLGIAPDAPVVFLPGTARQGSNHRLALWSSGILAFRDPAVRVLYTPGGNDAYIRRFARNTNAGHAMLTAPHLTDGDFARAADVAICVADGALDHAPLAAAAREGLPIVGTRSLWEREALHLPATLIDVPKPRLIARAALDVLDARLRQGPTRLSDAASAAEAWRGVLLEALGPRRAGD